MSDRTTGWRPRLVALDIDGTLAPIVARAEDSQVPEPTRHLLERLAARYGLVGCVSGRRAGDARRLVGLDDAAIAEERGIPIGTVASLASRGIQQIRDRLKASDLPHDYDHL